MDYKLPDVCPKLNLIERILIWLSGAEESCLRKCPKWEKRKYEAFGASVLVPVSFGMIGSSYAVSTLTDNLYIVIGFSIVWGSIILTIDRVLLATYRAFTTKSKKATQFVLRIIVAVLMGLTVSHPLTLLLFKDTINSEIAKTRTVEMKSIRAEADGEKKVIEDRIIQASQNLAQLQQKYEDTIAGEFATAPQASSTPAGTTNDVDRRFQDIDDQLTELKNEREQIRAGLEKWQKTYDDEISGVRGGSAGVGPKARAIEADHLIWRRDEMKRLNQTISELTSRRVNLSSSIMEKSAAANEAIEARKRDLEKQKLDLFASQQGQLVDVIKDQIASSSAELDRLRADAKQLSVDTSDRLKDIKTERRADMMTQTMVLHHIFEDPENGGHFALMVYVIIATLFTLIDTLPLVVKFFSVAGPYDMVQHIEGTKYTPFHNLVIEEDSDKFASRDLAFRRQMQARIDMFRDVDQYWGNNIPVLPNEGIDENPAELTSLIYEESKPGPTGTHRPQDRDGVGLGSMISASNTKKSPPAESRPAAEKGPVKPERVATPVQKTAQPQPQRASEIESNRPAVKQPEQKPETPVFRRPDDKAGTKGNEVPKATRPNRSGFDSPEMQHPAVVNHRETGGTNQTVADKISSTGQPALKRRRRGAAQVRGSAQDPNDVVLPS